MDNKKLKDNTTEFQQDQPPENWSRLSFVFSIFFPLAGLLFLFKQKHIFSRLLLQLDRNCVSVFCPSLSRREKLLKWAGNRLPDTWSSQSRTLAGGVAELWSDGSLLCTLINSAIPGACLNPHRHWRKPPLHAQAIAYKYLGVIPIFTDNDLSGNLTLSLERSFLHYLNELQLSIAKLSERNDIPKTVSVHYLVRGMGLYSGEQHRRTVFYVYPNTNITSHNSNILVHIRGPYATYGKAVIPKFHNNLFTTPKINITSDILTTKKLFNGTAMKPNNSFIKNFSLPFMHYHKKHMGDNIIIDIAMENDRAKVTYIPKNYGMYEIIMISNGELLRGCPFNVHILNNVSGIEDSFDATERQDDILGLRKRKILSKTIDFIDEQIPVADVLMTHKPKENCKPDNYLESKESKTILENEIIIKREEVNNEKEIHDETVDGIDKSELNYRNNPKPQKCEVLEKQNSESASEHHGVKANNANGNNLLIDHISNENDQTRNIVDTLNNYSNNRSTHKVVYNYVSVGLQLKSTTESTNDDKKVGDVLGQTQMFNTARKPNSDKLIPESNPRVEVNKIKIPEKFCEIQNTANKRNSTELHTKSFKNFINASNKKDLTKDISTELHENNTTKKEINFLQRNDSGPKRVLKGFVNDDNNNIVSNLNHSESKENIKNVGLQRNSKLDSEKNVPKRFHQRQNLEAPLYPTNTSPICLNHIVPEVDNEYQKMSVAEKRKIFAKKVPDKICTSPNSSFSETENAEGSPIGGHFKHFEGLSVLNYLGSLKTSERINKPSGYSLCSTMSLPNISSMQENTLQGSVKERRNFWERMSTSSSSLSLSSEASWKRKPFKMTEAERCRLIWKKPTETTSSVSGVIKKEDNYDLEKNADISKSADDILSLSFVKQDATKKYKSMDHSLDKCSVMSIDERKRILLKQNYIKELSVWRPTKSLRNERNFVNQRPLVENKRDENVNTFVFSSISDRIKRFDSDCNLLDEKLGNEVLRKPNAKEAVVYNAKKKPNNLVSNNVVRQNNRGSQDSFQPEVLTVKSHFKRAIKYFKNLEEKSLHASKSEKKLQSFDRRGRPNRKKGGSLNLPSTTKRFFVSNLYNDIFGDKRGSFKGAVNRSALVQALATFSRRENQIFEDDEDKITYEMFQKRAKIKRRRSIKSIFDVYY